MADKLTARQQAQLAVLRAYPRHLEQMHRLIEEIAGLRADDALVRRLCRLLDAAKIEANGVGLTSLADTMGNMSTMARRGGGIRSDSERTTRWFGGSAGCSTPPRSRPTASASLRWPIPWET